jgi:hypothetical protein
VNTAIEINIRGYDVIVDPEDVLRISLSGPWRPHRGSRKQYFVHSMPRPKHENILLHRFLVSAPDGMDVDHINGNTFDNRKENLRICTHSENQKNQKLRINNTSGAKGVSYDKRKKKWRPRITVDGKELFLGYFERLEDAKEAYKHASKTHHGAYGRIS